MKILIAVSPLTRGTHVVAKINLNTYKVGDIVSVSRDKSHYTILFKDQSKAKIAASRTRIFPKEGLSKVYSTEEVLEELGITKRKRKCQQH